MTYPIFPSAPPGRRIPLEFGCPVSYPLKGVHSPFSTAEEKEAIMEKLSQLADRVLDNASIEDPSVPEGTCVQVRLSEFNFNFLKGSLTIKADLGEDQIESELDIMDVKHKQNKKSYIADISPRLFSKIASTPCREEAEQITNIFIEIFNKYLREQNGPDHMDECLARSTIQSVTPGFKEQKNIERVDAMSVKDLQHEAGEKFKSFIQTLPTSLFKSKKAMHFLQEGLNQRSSLSDKILYLKQVLFLLTFQDVFKNTLEYMVTDSAISKSMQYTSSGFDYASEHRYQDRDWRIRDTLSQLPINSVLMLIPLACRASFAELSSTDDLSSPFRSEDYVKEECKKARKADLAFKNVIKKVYGKELQSFSVPTDHMNGDGLLTIEQYFMGISGLAISSGPNGRFPMHDHRTIYYGRSDITLLRAASDNAPAEFLMTAAQSYPGEDDIWVEERCLAYLDEMVGEISRNELDAIKGKIHNVREAINRISVDDLIKEKIPGEYVLRNSAMKKLNSLYDETKKRAGLAPSSNTKSSCSVM